MIPILWSGTGRQRKSGELRIPAAVLYLAGLLTLFAPTGSATGTTVHGAPPRSEIATRPGAYIIIASDNLKQHLHGLAGSSPLYLLEVFSNGLVRGEPVAPHLLGPDFSCPC